MKSNQTMIAVGAVVVIIIAIGVLVYFFKPAPQAPPPMSRAVNPLYPSSSSTPATAR